MWITEDDNKKLYAEFKEVYGNNVTHTYCPPCYESEKTKLGIKD